MSSRSSNVSSRTAQSPSHARTSTTAAGSPGCRSPSSTATRSGARTGNEQAAALCALPGVRYIPPYMPQGRVTMTDFLVAALFENWSQEMNTLSARNQLKGKIVEVKKGATTSHVRIDIGSGVVISAAITNDAVADLDLKSGDEAWAVIKASDVMVGV